MKIDFLHTRFPAKAQGGENFAGVLRRMRKRTAGKARASLETALGGDMGMGRLPEEAAHRPTGAPRPDVVAHKNHKKGAPMKSFSLSREDVVFAKEHGIAVLFPSEAAFAAKCRSMGLDPEKAASPHAVMLEYRYGTGLFSSWRFSSAVPSCTS